MKKQSYRKQFKSKLNSKLSYNPSPNSSKEKSTQLIKKKKMTTMIEISDIKNNFKDYFYKINTDYTNKDQQIKRLIKQEMKQQLSQIKKEIKHLVIEESSYLHQKLMQQITNQVRNMIQNQKSSIINKLESEIKKEVNDLRQINKLKYKNLTEENLNLARLLIEQSKNHTQKQMIDMRIIKQDIKQLQFKVMEWKDKQIFNIQSYKSIQCQQYKISENMKNLHKKILELESLSNKTQYNFTNLSYSIHQKYCYLNEKLQSHFINQQNCHINIKQDYENLKKITIAKNKQDLLQMFNKHHHQIRETLSPMIEIYNKNFEQMDSKYKDIIPIINDMFVTLKQINSKLFESMNMKANNIMKNTLDYIINPLKVEIKNIKMDIVGQIYKFEQILHKQISKQIQKFKHNSSSILE